LSRIFFSEVTPKFLYETDRDSRSLMNITLCPYFACCRNKFTIRLQQLRYDAVRIFRSGRKILYHLPYSWCVYRRWYSIYVNGNFPSIHCPTDEYTGPGCTTCDFFCATIDFYSGLHTDLPTGHIQIIGLESYLTYAFS